MIWAALHRLIQRYGFFRREPVVNWLGKDGLVNVAEWQDHQFFSEAAHKSRRLAQIARERCALKEQLAKAVKQKKARAPIYQALRALSIEELRVEAGK